MNQTGSNGSCQLTCWIIAALLGALVLALLMTLGEWAFLPAAVFGAVAFVVGGLFLGWAFCSGTTAANAQRAGEAPVTARSGSTSTSAASSERLSDKVARAEDKMAEIGDTVKAKAASAADTVSETVSDAKDKAASAASTVKAKANDATQTAKAKADDATQTAKAKASKAASTASKKADGVASSLATDSKPAKKPAKKAAAKPKAAPVAKDGKPVMLTKARAGGADDLKQIKGVGPKLEGMLHKMGVFHFDQVASWRKAEVEWVDQNLEGFKGRVSRDDWVPQAKVLAKGGTTEFSSKVKKGGVY